MADSQRHHFTNGPHCTLNRINRPSKARRLSDVDENADVYGLSRAKGRRLKPILNGTREYESVVKRFYGEIRISENDENQFLKHFLPARPASCRRSVWPERVCWVRRKQKGMNLNGFSNNKVSLTRSGKRTEARMRLVSGKMETEPGKESGRRMKIDDRGRVIGHVLPFWKFRNLPDRDRNIVRCPAGREKTGAERNYYALARNGRTDGRADREWAIMIERPFCFQSYIWFVGRTRIEADKWRDRQRPVVDNNGLSMVCSRGTFIRLSIVVRISTR